MNQASIVLLSFPPSRFAHRVCAVNPSNCAGFANIRCTADRHAVSSPSRLPPIAACGRRHAAQRLLRPRRRELYQDYKQGVRCLLEEAEAATTSTVRASPTAGFRARAGPAPSSTASMRTSSRSLAPRLRYRQAHRGGKNLVVRRGLGEATSRTRATTVHVDDRAARAQGQIRKGIQGLGATWRSPGNRGHRRQTRRLPGGARWALFSPAYGWALHANNKRTTPKGARLTLRRVLTRTFPVLDSGRAARRERCRSPQTWPSGDGPCLAWENEAELAKEGIRQRQVRHSSIPPSSILAEPPGRDPSTRVVDKRGTRKGGRGPNLDVPLLPTRARRIAAAKLLYRARSPAAVLREARVAVSPKLALFTIDDTFGRLDEGPQEKTHFADGGVCSTRSTSRAQNDGLAGRVVRVDPFVRTRPAPNPWQTRSPRTLIVKKPSTLIGRVHRDPSAFAIHRSRRANRSMRPAAEPASTRRTTSRAEFLQGFTTRRS